MGGFSGSYELGGGFGGPIGDWRGSMDWGDIGVPIGDSWGSYGVGVAFGPYRGVSGIYGLGGGLSGSYRGLLGRPMGWGSFSGSMAWLGVLWIGGALGVL